MIHKSDGASTSTSAASPSPTDEDLNMSMSGVPNQWVAAQQESPIPYEEYEVLTGSASLGRIPLGGADTTFVANTTAVGAALVGGFGWYLLDVADIYAGPWVAPLVALIIGLAVRLASDVESAYKAVVSMAAYLLTLMVLLLALTHRDLTQIYDSIDSFQVYETTLIRTRLQDPLHISAYLIGAVVAVQTAYLGARR